MRPALYKAELSSEPESIRPQRLKRNVAIARFTNETKYGQSFCLDQDRLIETLLDKPWRAYLLSYQNGTYLVSGGKSQGIRAGDVFSVYQKGEKVKNPQTGLFF